MNSKLPPNQRATLLVQAMTLDDKLQQLSMSTGSNPDLPNCQQRNDTRHIEGIPRLRIPTIRMTNGPIGVAGGDCDPNPTTTGLPTALAVAASWDPKLSYQWGEIAGRETRSIGHHVFLAPGMNLGRVPHNGRNFEYFGEDPYLSGVMGVQQIKAVEAQGIQATAKHFVANEQETQRLKMNTIIGDRTLHELYLLPFEMSVKDANPAAVMCSYPRINGLFACENPALLTTILRHQWGYRGYVMSDRGATNSTEPSIKAGLDLEFGTKPIWFTPAKLHEALNTGSIAMTDLDAMLIRRFAAMFRLGQFDAPITGVRAIDFSAHGKTARTIAAQGSVLLKNNGVLPLAPSIKSFALIGPRTFAGSAKFPATAPQGRISVTAPYTVTPVDGIKEALKNLKSSATVEFNDGADLSSARALAARSEIVIVMAGDISLEGEDREDLSLPKRDNIDQDALIAAVAAVNPRTIIVLKDGGPVLTPWLDQVAALLECWYPGQEDGNAVADLLFGLENPSGKLPISFPRSEADTPRSSPERWPGVMINGTLTATYSEGLRIGYRDYVASGTKPQFSFGYGLSYTEFSISLVKMKVSIRGQRRQIVIDTSVKNVGKRFGSEVPQVYLGLPSSTQEPPVRLVAFEKVWLAPGELKKVRFLIDSESANHPLGYWDSDTQTWRIAPGQYHVFVGNSSTNIVSSRTISIR
jgi:beta-glucosidase